MVHLDDGVGEQIWRSLAPIWPVLNNGPGDVFLSCSLLRRATAVGQPSTPRPPSRVGRRPWHAPTRATAARRSASPHEPSAAASAIIDHAPAA